MLTLTAAAIAGLSHTDLLERASRGERVLLLLPSMETARTALAGLTDATTSSTLDWRVVRTAGRYAVHHSSGGWIRVHTSGNSDFGQGMTLDHARVFVPGFRVDRIREVLMPGLFIGRGELELHVVA